MSLLRPYLDPQPVTAPTLRSLHRAVTFDRMGREAEREAAAHALRTAEPFPDRTEP